MANLLRDFRSIGCPNFLYPAFTTSQGLGHEKQHLCLEGSSTPTPQVPWRRVEVGKGSLLHQPLGGELATNRKWVSENPSDFSGLTLQKSHVNHWGELTH